MKFKSNKIKKKNIRSNNNIKKIKLVELPLIAITTTFTINKQFLIVISHHLLSSHNNIILVPYVLRVFINSSCMITAAAEIGVIVIVV